MKKQLAVLMAAATAVTAVAPVVSNAAVTDNGVKSLGEFINVAKEALDSKNYYTDAKTQTSGNEFKKSRYYAYIYSSAALTGYTSWTTSLPSGTVDGLDFTLTKNEGKLERLGNVAVIKNTDNLLADLEKLTADGNADVKLVVYDRGAKDGKQNYMTNQVVFAKSTKTGSTKALFNSARVANYIKSVKYRGIDGEVLDSASAANSYSVDVELTNGKVLTYKMGDEAVDFTKPVNDKGEDVPTDDASLDSLKASVVGFKKLDELEDAVEVKVAQGDANIYELSDSTVDATYTLPAYYTGENGYTEDGADFVNNFHKFNVKPSVARDDTNKITNYNGSTLNVNGTSYLLAKTTGVVVKDDTKLETVKDGYQLTVNIPVVDSNDKSYTKTLALKFTSASLADLTKFRDDLLSKKEVVAGRFKKLAGDDRYQTAIEVSKEAFKVKGSADSVVIVGGNALLDGLSAAPLAAANNATVLLASPRTGLSQATIDEIARATKDKLYNRTVYVVGGTDSVPASVDKVLADKFGATVVRLAGDDRYATSKKIAERLVYDKKVSTSTEKANIFLVGGNGAADAMSVAPVATSKVDKINASGKVSPILVVKKDGIDQETRNFLVDKLNIAGDNVKTYLVGGENSLGITVLRDAKKVGSKNVKRLSGDDRYATNLAIIKEFYVANSSTLIPTDGLTIASGTNNALVDAQTVGAFAGVKKSPILLTGEKLTDAQVDLLKKPADKTGVASTVFYVAANDKYYDLGITGRSTTNGIKSNVYQIGGAVSTDVMKVVVDKFNL